MLFIASPLHRFAFAILSQSTRHQSPPLLFCSKPIVSFALRFNAVLFVSYAGQIQSGLHLAFAMHVLSFPLISSPLLNSFIADHNTSPHVFSFALPIRSAQFLCKSHHFHTSPLQCSATRFRAYAKPFRSILHSSITYQLYPPTETALWTNFSTDQCRYTYHNQATQ